MKKVSSAPNLQDYTGKRSSLDQHAGGRLPKAMSSQALAGPRIKDSMNTGAKPRNVSTDSLASLIATVGPPSVAELEEFAESAKGLAGLDCYEKFGRPEPHPPLGGGDDSLAEGTQADEETQAMAACLATPYTADERNLGEQVEEAARERMSAIEEELGARLEESTITTRVEVHKLDEKEQGRKKSPQRRKRRLREALGMGRDMEPVGPKQHFEDNDLADQYLTQQALFESMHNRGI